MPSLIETLVRDDVLLCPSCGTGKLKGLESTFVCEACAAVWPVRNNVPDFFNQYLNKAAAPEGLVGAGSAAVSRDVVARIVSTLDLPGGAAVTTAVAEIVARSASLSCDDAALSAEINDLIDRFAGSDQSIDQPPPVQDANLAPEVTFERHYFASTVPAGSRYSANVRLRNSGRHPWSSRTTDPVVVMASWRNGTREPALTAFPIDVAPGRAISVPVRLRAPAESGEHVLRIDMAWGNGLRTIGHGLEIPIDVRARRTGWRRLLPSLSLGPPVDPHVKIGRSIPDYAKDHADGVKMIESHFNQLGRTRYRVLEVGSGTHPHMAWLEYCEVVGLDISSPLLELGSLYFRDRFPERLGFVCADALHAPFKPGSFDAVVMFSALHHFAEPEILLARLAKLMRPDGFVAVMCEPVGDALEGGPTIRDLLKGINEQVFSLPEYRHIFRQAGLAEVRIKVDGGSLKAILQNAPANTP